MSFTLEVSKTGKDTIVYNDHKYRERYSIKSGDIVWQCLGRVCKASITTDNNKTAIYRSNENHTGQHPVTLRSHTPSPPSQRRCSTETNKPKLISDMLTTSITPSSGHVTPEATVMLPDMSIQKNSHPSRDLLEQNRVLKDELDKIKAEAEWKQLSTNSWLTDDHFRIYMDVVFNLTVNASDEVLFMNPSVCHAIKLSTDFNYLLDPLSLSSKAIIFVPINNNLKPEEEGGSHWSLLIYVKKFSRFYYYDSFKNLNLQVTDTICKKLSSYLLNDGNPKLTSINGPTQDNGYDCALYCILTVEHFLRNISESNIFEMSVPAYGAADCLIKRAMMSFVIQNRYFITKQDLLKLMDATSQSSEQYTCQQESLHQFKCNLIKKTEETEKLKREVKALNDRNISDKFINPKRTCKAKKYILESVTPLNNQFRVLTDRMNDDDSDTIDEEVTGQLTPIMAHRISNVRSRVGNLRPYTKNVRRDNIKILNKRKIIIMADSHGRRLGGALQELVGDRVVAYVKPGASFGAVVDGIEDVNHEDTLVIVAGTNNINNSTDGTDLLKQMEVLIDGTKHTNVVLASIPYRYDSPWHNINISRINNKLYDLAAHWKHVSILPLHDMPRYYHTKHGLHFNWLGKKKIAKDIAQLLFKTNVHYSEARNNMGTEQESMSMVNLIGSQEACQTPSLDAAHGYEHEPTTETHSCPSGAARNLPILTDSSLLADELPKDPVSPFLERLDIFPPLT